MSVEQPQHSEEYPFYTCLAHKCKFAPLAYGNLRNEITRKIRDPSLIEDERLREEVQRCVEDDDNYSPLVEKARHTTGMEYEFMLMVSVKSTCTDISRKNSVTLELCL